MSYCAICGGTGWKLDGTPCGCKAVKGDLYGDITCLDIPETYRGLAFNTILLPVKYGDAYKNTMKNYYEQISSLRWRCRNLLLCAPAQSGKSVFAYSLIQELFRRGIDVFPMYDVLEIKRIMLDMEYGKQQSLKVENPILLYEVPYLFAVIPPLLNFDTYDTTAMLVARRVRRGGSTILLYSGTWNQLVSNDSRGSLKNMKGNGSLTTVEVSSWSEKED